MDENLIEDNQTVEPEKLDLHSHDITEDKRKELLNLFPEIRTEGGKLDFDRLKLALGESVDIGKERYGMNWPGKADCFKTIQMPSLATLRPCPEESINFNMTENLIIEGDNLEVLKLLQKSYLGKVKMIYIDPPYNTGNDFIYPDNYSESLQTYLEYTGQVDAEGRKFGTNSDTDGRFHSKWLNMMYPRLYLARNLLREDGVIMFSIDDHEVANLRTALNETFSEENLIAQLVWEKGRKNDAKLFSIGHEYVIVFAKSLAFLREKQTIWREEKPGAGDIWEEYLRLRKKHGKDFKAIEFDLQAWFQRLPKTHPSKKWSRYKHIDKHGPWRDDNISWPGGNGPTYDVIHPLTKKPCKVPERGWVYADLETMLSRIKAGIVEFRADHTEPPIRKSHLRPIIYDEKEDEVVSLDEPDETNGNNEEEELATQVRGSYFYKQSQVAVKYLRKLMGVQLFNNPKDHEELLKLFRYVLADEQQATILDFFAGSGATAEAVLQLNQEDDARYRFMLVQLPEPCNPSEKTGKAASHAGFSTVVEITKERIRRVIKKFTESDAGKLDLEGKLKQDRGFKVFKLAESNFNPWNADVPHEAGALEQQLNLHIDHIREGRTAGDLLYEILLKSGFPLTTPSRPYSSRAKLSIAWPVVPSSSVWIEV